MKTNERCWTIFIWLGLFIGSAIGSYVPEMWGESIFSISSILCGMVGAVVGLCWGFKMSDWMDM